MSLTGRILVTGGSGTLGHAIVRTALQEKWDADFTIFSRSELRQAQMRAQYPQLRYVLGDARDYDRLSAAIVGHDVCVHGAAMKRIPEAEAQPVNCIETNVIGSMNVVRACIAGGVKRCIGVSTDKACRAITAYGASKKIMESLFQAQPDAPCVFTLVRYGNVVASNGSVIPLWRQQAKEGRPISVTRKDATRFWMGETEAVRLIEHAAEMPAGTITIPKMRSLSLEELAQIIAPEADVVETGFRSVEKLHEDLLSPDERASETFSHIILSDAGSTRNSYTSYDAPRLSPAAFRAMLAEAEQHD